MIQTLQRISKPIALRHYKNTFKQTNDDQHRIADDSQIAEFGRLIYSKCKDGKTLSKEAIAELVGRVTNSDKITEREASRWISLVRGFMIHEYNETFIYVRPDGYKIAQGIERIHQVGKIGHMAMKWRQRFVLTASILSKNELEAARANYIARLLKDEKQSGLITEQFLLDFKDNSKLIGREVRNAQK